MARDLDLRGKVTMDGADKAASQLDDVADAAKKAEEPVELTVDAKVDRALSALDDIVTDAKKAQTAADALGRALGPELAAKADMQQIIRGFERAGLSLDDITAKAGDLGAKLKDAAGPGGENLDALAGRARAAADDTGKLADSARGANSALANMIGNSAQDVGALSGVAGSAGVALGQMAEYAADAAFGGEKLGAALKSMVAVAGPIAVLTLVIGTITSLMEAQQAEAAAAAARTKQFGEAMAGASDDARGLADSLRENSDEITKFNASAEGFGGGIIEGLAQVGKAVPFLGGLLGDAGQGITNLTPIMDAAGLSMYELATAIERGGKVGDDWSRVLLDAMHTGKITSDQFGQLSEAIGKYGQEALKAKDAQKLWNVDAGEANQILQDLGKQKEPLSTMGNEWATLMGDMSNGTINTVQAADAINLLSEKLGLTREQVVGLAQAQLDENMKAAAAETERATQAAQEYAQVLSSSDWGAASVNAAVTGWTKLAEAQFGLTNIAANSQAAYDSLGAAIEENGFTFDIATEKGRANGEQIQNLYSSIIPQLSAAFADSGGSIDTFGSKMDALRTGVFQQLDEQTGLTADQINAVIDQLGVFDGTQYAAEFQMLGLEEANAKLALLSGVIGTLSEPAQKQITLAIIAGDPQLALDTVSADIQGHPLPPAVVGTEIDPTGAQQGAEAFANSDQPPATTDLLVDPATGKRTVDAFTAERRETDPVKVDANTKAAIGTMVLLYGIAQALQPVVTVVAKLGDYPTATEIANRIGVVRVPVDTYLRNEVRVTGGRP